jgi:ferric-dicitrate binding protein FerR (iron transport regulator)
MIVFSHETIFKESGETMTQVMLPDGSTVWLNKNSRLAYHDDFNKENRTVILAGEAFFEVIADRQKPFVVQTPQARVKVLGTSFNVNTYAGESKTTEVFVVTGIVNFSNNKGANEGIDLKAGELAAASNNTVMLLTSDDSNILAWKEKRLIFQKSPLNSVAKNLEAYFKIDIEIMNEDIGRCRFTGSFDQPTLEEIIEALSVSLDLTIVKKDDTYVVDGNGC